LALEIESLWAFPLQHLFVKRRDDTAARVDPIRSPIAQGWYRSDWLHCAQLPL
jgi:hypothetical protein